MVLYQHGPWIDFRARLAEIVATLQHPYSHTPPTLLSYTELHPKPLLSYTELHPKPLLSYTDLHPKPAKGFLCLIAIRAARDKKVTEGPSTTPLQFNALQRQPACAFVLLLLQSKRES